MGAFRLPAAVLIAALTACTPDRPQSLDTRELTYRQDGTELRGFVAYPAGQEARPGVLVVHEWWGHNDHARQQARRLAESGYVGFALDMYGSGRVTTHPDSAQAFVAEAMRDPAVLAARFNAALEELKRDPRVDADRIAAIGYCFGGAVVLGMARAGVDLDAVVSFHGALPMSPPVDSGAVRARVVVLTGAADPMIPPEQVEAFTQQMRAAGARIDVESYPGVLHSFTNPRADSVGMPGLGYDAEADRRSWETMLRTLSEAFR